MKKKRKSMVQECIRALGRHQNNLFGRCRCIIVTVLVGGGVTTGVASLSLSCLSVDT